MPTNHKFAGPQHKSQGRQQQYRPGSGFFVCSMTRFSFCLLYTAFPKNSFPRVGLRGKPAPEKVFQQFSAVRMGLSG